MAFAIAVLMLFLGFIQFENKNDLLAG